MKTRSIYRGYRFPPDIIAHAAWLYHRFALGLRDVEDLLAERGIEVSHETNRQWCATFGPQFARCIQRSLGRRGDRWFLDGGCVNRRQARISVACGRPSRRCAGHSGPEAKRRIGKTKAHFRSKARYWMV